MFTYLLMHLLLIGKYNSLYTLLKDIFSTRMIFNDLYNQLCHILSPSPSDYWYYLCKDSFFKKHKFWGSNLQTEIIGNIFIPFFYQEALNTNSYGFMTYLEEFYFYLPAKNRYAKLRTYKQWFEFTPSIEKYFYFNQALLFMQNHYINDG